MTQEFTTADREQTEQEHDTVLCVAFEGHGDTVQFHDGNMDEDGYLIADEADVVDAQEWA